MGWRSKIRVDISIGSSALRQRFFTSKKKSVRIDVNCAFQRSTTRELYYIRGFPKVDNSGIDARIV